MAPLVKALPANKQSRPASGGRGGCGAPSVPVTGWQPNGQMLPSVMARQCPVLRNSSRLIQQVPGEQDAVVRV